MNFFTIGTTQNLRPEDVGMNHENGIMLLNFIADFWDLKEHYGLLPNLTQEKEEIKANNPSRPSCTVIIKFLEDQKDIFVAHNTWHIYQAMSYKFLKNYDLNYHVLPGSSSIIPGHKISMSSYAGDTFIKSLSICLVKVNIF